MNRHLIAAIVCGALPAFAGAVSAPAAVVVAGAAAASSARAQHITVAVGGPTACNRCHAPVHPLYEVLDRKVMHPEWHLEGWSAERRETPEGDIYAYTREGGEVRRLYLFRPYGDARFHFMLPARGDNPHRLP